MFWKKGEEEKGTLGIPMTNMPYGPAVCDGSYGLDTRPLGDTGVDKPNFNDTTGAIDMVGLGALTREGETQVAIKAEVGLEISPRPSPDLDITTLKGTPTT